MTKGNGDIRVNTISVFWSLSLYQRKQTNLCSSSFNLCAEKLAACLLQRRILGNKIREPTL